MRVLFITAHKYLPQMYGGLQTSTDQLCQYLLKQGHHVSVLAGLLPGGAFALKARIAMKINALTKGHAIARDQSLGYPVWYAWEPWNQVAAAVAEESPDVIAILAHEPVRMALAAKPLGIPMVMMLMDVEFEKHGGDFAELGRIACIANSHFTADRYRQAYGVDSTVVYPMLDLTRYEIESRREAVTFINPVPEKGRDLACEIARLCPDIPFDFVEGWPLSPDQREALMARLEGLRNVTLRPQQTDMRQVYGKSRILLVPSLWEEAFGRVVSEAQVSGIPVVASARGGLPEAVGEGGVLLDPEGPAQDWAAAIRRLWSDPDHYRMVSEAARAQVARDEMRFVPQCQAIEAVLARSASQPRKAAL